MRFIGAKNYTRLSGPPRQIDLVVVHSGETGEGTNVAEGVANFFAGLARDPAPAASAHLVVDDKSVIQCVRLQDVAWGAPSANANGIHVELAGRADQTPAEWADEYSAAVLDLSAHVVASLCLLYAIPVVFIDATDLKLGNRGLTTHSEVSKAFGGTHTDPGPSWPAAAFVATVGRYLRMLQQLGPYS